MSKENTHSDLEISPDEVADLIATKPGEITLVDVREEWELTRGMLPGAVHRPLSRLADFVDPWQSSKICIIYCEHGIRSMDVAAWLQQNKQIHTRSMSGGFAQWRGPTQPPTSGDKS